MNDSPQRRRSIELAALAAATGPDGQVDLTAYEAQRLILRHQNLDGIDANALVAALTRNPAYQSEAGRQQVGPLLAALRERVPAAARARLDEALDGANVGESGLRRAYEDWIEQPVARALRQGTQAVGEHNQQISDALATSLRWAEGLGKGPQSPWLERAASQLAAQGIGDLQSAYGTMKGASQQALSVMGDTVDLARLAYRFGTDSDFRYMMIGAAAMYAAEVARDPGKPVDDIRNAAVNAFNEWSRGLEQAQAEGKEQEYLGQAQGAVGVELIASIVPISKVAKLGKLARAVDKADDLPPARTPDGPAEARATGELAQALTELSRDAARAQARGGLERRAGDLFFSGLAGVKRSQGELNELVDGLRKHGEVDGLLRSGALTPNELGYLARRDVQLFEGEVSFHQALDAHIGQRPLSALGRREVGDIGEAITAHDLARKGYRDLVPIQNNSGHGNDLLGINPETNRWEVLEVKASVQGMAKSQTGEPFPLVTKRLERAAKAESHWASKNVWEEQTKPTAQRVLDEVYDQATEKLDVDPKWSRVNIERDAATGELKATPEISDWQSPAQRRPAPEESHSLAPLPPGFAPALRHGRDIRTPDHPGHDVYAHTLKAVQRMEAEQGIAPGPHTELLAARLTAESAERKQGITRVEMGKDGRIHAIERHYAEDEGRRFGLPAAEATAVPVETSGERWLAAASSHYVSTQPPAERTEAHEFSLQVLPPRDRRMFSLLRALTPAHIGDEPVAQAMLEAKRSGIHEMEQVTAVMMLGDQLNVIGERPDQRIALNVTAEALPMQESIQQTLEVNQQRQQQEQQQAQVKAMSLG
ncbi:hypothetical protein EBB59_12745 [Lysobacter pythonis]|uniref:X-Tfes XVIPCD domain-containing protein n=1 Tax=Solilutibacter pythonis TaxID=2483112 RepID=A0A3M2HD00_9GAMM|nr:XVIPCD domain-containing protein [Lysobacter pythonis]RMH87626.1 hypothetical protein EBB59_12745 [Lysobacter pythonis]